MFKIILWHKELGRYGAAGLVATVADFIALLFFKEVIGINYLWAAAWAFVIGLTVSYLISIFYVFDHYERRHGYLETVYALIAVSGLAINHWTIWLTVEVVGVNYLLAKALSSVIIGYGSFCAKKILLFNDKNRIKR
ncbi:MAG: GtrA family protein [Candidatus Falkowbacteria bacterium]